MRITMPGKGQVIMPGACTLGALIASLAFGFSLASGPVSAADAKRGGIVYETRCKACHEDSVHNRDARKSKSFDALRAQVLRWSAEAGGVWTADEIDDVARYLNERYYHFPCPQIMCKADQALLKR
jgi:mono/diheme cytochrome c family protein